MLAVSDIAAAIAALDCDPALCSALKSQLQSAAPNFISQFSSHNRLREQSPFPMPETVTAAQMSLFDNWIEFGGAGMVDPNVFAAVGYDPEEYTGFAFGLGIERFCMKHYSVDDIRRFYENDMRFLSQF